MLTRSTSIPRPKISVATRILFSKFLNSLYLEILLNSSVSKAYNLAVNDHVPFLLSQARVHGDAREATLPEQLVQFDSTSNTLDENDDLVKIERVEEVVQLAVLLSLLKSEKVLLETVESELRLVVDEDLKGL